MSADSEGFSYANMAFNADRKLQTAFSAVAWAHSLTNSDAVLACPAEYELIKDSFAPDTYFIDVWSSEPPDFSRRRPVSIACTRATFGSRVRVYPRLPGRRPAIPKPGRTSTSAGWTQAQAPARERGA